MKTTERNRYFCAGCGKKILEGIAGLEYGVGADGRMYCYECCGKKDARNVADLEFGERYRGYLTGSGEKRFGNWCNTFCVQVTYSQSRHNICGINGRTDFWFSYAGKHFHGVSISKKGSNDTAVITRVAGATK